MAIDVTVSEYDDDEGGSFKFEISNFDQALQRLVQVATDTDPLV